DPNATYRDGVTRGGSQVTGNLISGNRGNGINLAGGTIAGNYIGTDATGRRALGNDGNGIAATATELTVGGAGPNSVPTVIDPAGAGRNVISANGGHGIFL